jgi:tetratricopeptide (TPR) repeat protein
MDELAHQHDGRLLRCGPSMGRPVIRRGSTCLVLVATALAWAMPAPAAAQKADAAVLERRLTDAAAAHPDSFQALHALGEFYLHAGRLAAAIPWLERARALEPAHAANGYDLAQAYLQTGRIDAAKQQVSTMLRAGETAELLNLQGDIEARTGDRAAAAASYQRAAYARPSEEHLFDWGDNLLHLRAYNDAADVFTAAVRRYPASARLRIGLGIAEYSRGQHEAALQAFCRAADLAPADPRPIGFLGEMYGVAPAQSAEVTRRLARFVQRRPQSAEGHYYYAMNLWRGEGGVTDAATVAKAEALLRKAAVLDARYAKPRLQLGILLSEQNRWGEAVPFLKAAVALEPDQPQGHFRLSQAYRRSGQTALADDELAIFKRLRAAPQP